MFRGEWLPSRIWQELICPSVMAATVLLGDCGQISDIGCPLSLTLVWFTCLFLCVMLCQEHTSVSSTTFILLSLLLYPYLFYFVSTMAVSKRPVLSRSGGGAGWWVPDFHQQYPLLSSPHRPGDPDPGSHWGAAAKLGERQGQGSHRACRARGETIVSFESNRSKKHKWN